MTYVKPPCARNPDQDPDSSGRLAERGRLCGVILAHAMKGEMARRVIGYLFNAIGIPERICAQDITDNGGPHGDGNVCPFMSRLREQISDFFDYHLVGRKEPHRVAFPTDDRGNYALHIEPNQPPKNLVEGFWSPYLSGENVLLVYPERHLADESISICFAAGTSFNGGSERSPREDIYADRRSGDAVVSASCVRSILRLGERFRSWHVGVTATAIRPSVDVLYGTDLIVLATPASMPRLLPNLEEAARMKTGADAVTVMFDTREGGKRRTYADTLENRTAGNAFETVKWGVVTRHRFPFQRAITVLAARDEFAVEAMLQFLLNEDAMLMLARELRCGEVFPDHFQALFRLHMFKGQQCAHEMTVEEAIVLGANRKADSLSKK